MSETMNPKAVKNARRRERRRREREQEDIRAVWSTPEGRRYAWRVMKAAGVAQISFDPGRPDPYVTVFHEGERNIGNLMLVDVMAACPDLYFLAMSEAHKAEEIERQALSKPETTPEEEDLDG
jgi:hypothetical protein